MTDLLLTAGAFVSLLAWIWLLCLRGGFWRADRGLPGQVRLPEPPPAVVAVIPARDEAETIRTVLQGHAASDYRGRLTVILVDDGSTDGTGEIARQVAARSARPIHVLSAPPLPEGWTGKLWALETGIRAAGEIDPEAEWLLLTDADILHQPEALGRLVTYGADRQFALVSLMARLDDRGFWGGLLIPAFLFFFQKLYPFGWVADPARDTAGAAGGCVLIRREALAEIGGIASIRGALIDDCTLAARVKRGPPRRGIWLGLARNTVESMRDNRHLGTIWRMVARTAFAQLRHSTLLLAGTLAGMALVYLAGPLAVLTLPLHGAWPAALLGAAAWGLSARAYRPTLRLFGRPWWQAFALPLAAFFYTLMTLDSARRHWMGRGGAWKGRTYPSG